MTDSLLIHNATVCTFGDANRVIEDGAIIIEGGKITAVGAAAELLAAHPTTPREDAGGKLLMPAFVRYRYVPIWWKRNCSPPSCGRAINASTVGLNR